MRFAYIGICFAACCGVYVLSGVAWSAMVLLSILLLAIAWHDRKSRAVLMYIGAALLFVQLWMMAGLGESTWIAFFATWVAVSWAMWRRSGVHNWPSIALCVFSALAYLFGRISGADFAPTPTGFPYLLAGNVFVILAIVVAGARGALFSGDMAGGYWTSGGSGLGSDFGVSTRFAHPDYPVSASKIQKEKMRRT